VYSPPPGTTVRQEFMRRLSWKLLRLCLTMWTKMSMPGLYRSVRERDSLVFTLDDGE